MESNFLNIGLKAIKKAEEVILKYYSDEIRYTLKEDQTPVTLADQGAEEIIVKIIKEQFPNHGFLGEEGNQDKNKEYLWIIDPIDGTKNYLRKIPLFATQLALMHNGKIILGISNAPALKELLFAEKGKGAYLYCSSEAASDAAESRTNQNYKNIIQNSKKITVSAFSDLSKSFLVYGSVRLFQKHHKLEKLLSLANNVQGCKGFGDFYNYHLLANGRVDIAVEADCKIWDIAALSLIINEAGGIVTDINGKKIDLNTTSLLATNKELFPEVSQYFY